MIKVKYLEYTEIDSVILHSGGKVITTGGRTWMDESSSNISKLEIHEFDNGTLYIRATTRGENNWNVHKYASFRGDYTIVYKDEEILS